MFTFRVTRHLMFAGQDVTIRDPESGRTITKALTFSTAGAYIADCRALGIGLNDMFKAFESGQNWWVFPTIIVRRNDGSLSNDDRQRLSMLLTELGASKVQFD